MTPKDENRKTQLSEMRKISIPLILLKNVFKFIKIVDADGKGLNQKPEQLNERAFLRSLEYE